jgi:hypothetical protein
MSSLTQTLEPTKATVPNVETRVINGNEYAVTLFPAMHGYFLARKLLNVFTNPDPIGKLCEIDQNGDLILELLANTVRNKETINILRFNIIFSGNFKELVAALKLVVEVNFKDFLQGDGTGAKKNPLQDLMETLSGTEEKQPQ